LHEKKGVLGMDYFLLFFHNHSLAKSDKICAKIIKFSDTGYWVKVEVERLRN